MAWRGVMNVAVNVRVPSKRRSLRGAWGVAPGHGMLPAYDVVILRLRESFIAVLPGLLWAMTSRPAGPGTGDL